jgi:hypothetical protein
MCHFYILPGYRLRTSACHIDNTLHYNTEKKTPSVTVWLISQINTWRKIQLFRDIAPCRLVNSYRHIAFTFQGRAVQEVPWLLEPEYKGITFFRNVVNCSPNIS